MNQLLERQYNFAFTKRSPSRILIGVTPEDHNTYKIVLRSDFVEEVLARTFLDTKWFNVIDEQNAGNRGNLFESYIRVLFSQGIVTFDYL
jgi:hypothetical protein